MKEAEAARKEPDKVLPVTLSVGDHVHIKGQESVGTILEIKNNKALRCFWKYPIKDQFGQIGKRKTEKRRQNPDQLSGTRVENFR
jgi:hypothetical protein